MNKRHSLCQKKETYLFALQCFPYDKEKSDSTYSIALCPLDNKNIEPLPSLVTA